MPEGSPLCFHHCGRCAGSEGKAARNLNHARPWISGDAGGGNLSEAPAGYGSRRVGELRVVQYVVKLASNFEPQAVLKQVGDLAEGKIGIHGVGSAYGVAPQGSVGGQR